MGRAKVRARLSAYRKMEAANVALAPAFGWWLVTRAGGEVGWPLLLAMAATSLLLLVGAAAWRMELAELGGDRRLAARLLPPLAWARTPTLLLTLAAVIAAGWQLWRDAGWTATAIATVAYALLAALEWVNYYRVQLQHFDHMADVKRLLAGRGFREAHLAKAIRRRRA